MRCFLCFIAGCLIVYCVMVNFDWIKSKFQDCCPAPKKEQDKKTIDEKKLKENEVKVLNKWQVDHHNTIFLGNDVIKDATVWKYIWKALGTDLETPVIDFENNVVLAIYLGEKPGGSSVDVVNVLLEDEILMVKIATKIASSLKKSSPACFVCIPKVEYKEILWVD